MVRDEGAGGFVALQSIDEPARFSTAAATYVYFASSVCVAIQRDDHMALLVPAFDVPVRFGGLR